MAQRLRVRYDPRKGDFAKAMKNARNPIARASTRAMDQVGDLIKVEGRASIAAGGLSKRWQNALRTNRYPRRGTSINPALLAYHKIPYAEVFEEGANIKGSPLLWIPLSSVPKKLSGNKRFSVKNYMAQVGPLVRVNRPGKVPLLLGKPPNGIKKGRTRSQKALFQRFSSKSIVPLFAGISAVTIRKRFSLRAVFRRGANALPRFYYANFRDGD